MNSTTTSLEYATEPAGSTLANLKKLRRALGAGSCLAYDLLSELRSEQMNLKLWWRIATASLVSPFGGDDIDLGGIPFEEDERRNFRNDFFKDADRREEADWAEFFIIDLFRDTYGLAELPSGAIVTLTQEYEKYNLLERLPGAKVVPFGSARHLDLWIGALPRYVELIARGKKPILLAEVYLTPLCLNDDGRFLALENLDAADVKRKNFYLYHYYNIFLHHCPQAIRIRLKPWTYFTTPRHLWGQGPLHFSRQTWQTALESIDVEAMAADVRAGSEQWRDFSRRSAGLSLQALRGAIETF